MKNILFLIAFVVFPLASSAAENRNSSAAEELSQELKGSENDLQSIDNGATIRGNLCTLVFT